MSLRSTDRNRAARELFDPLPDRYDRLAELLSFGQNRRWRRAMVDHVVGVRPDTVLDVASGTAGVAVQLAGRGAGRVVAVDLTEPMLRRGQVNVAASGLSGRVDFTVGQAERLPFRDACFDGLTFTYLFRYVADPQATLEELARVVRPGGAVASLEFFVPPNRFWRGWWWLYTRLVLPVAGWLTGGRAWWDVGRFLGPSISSYYRDHSLSWHREVWEKCGFVDVGVRVMSLGGGLVMWGTRSVG
jgi:demethylmenaquinone methyltransferase / 2-methoxy-6-polyprenyl-1,4-benzoquinol methylase